MFYNNTLGYFPIPFSYRGMQGMGGNRTRTTTGPTAAEIGTEVAKAVAQALQGATLTLDGVDYLSNATAARINTAIARGV